MTLATERIGKVGTLDAMAFYQGALIVAMSINRLDIGDKILDIIDLMDKYSIVEAEFHNIENQLSIAKQYFHDSTVHRKPSWWKRLKTILK